jgi:hypothetical protein
LPKHVKLQGKVDLRMWAENSKLCTRVKPVLQVPPNFCSWFTPPLECHMFPSHNYHLHNLLRPDSLHRHHAERMAGHMVSTLILIQNAHRQPTFIMHAESHAPIFDASPCRLTGGTHWQCVASLSQPATFHKSVYIVSICFTRCDSALLTLEGLASADQ